MWWRSGLLLCAGAFLGCASGPRPIASPEASAAAIRAAEELQAASDPRGALYLQLAKEGMERGKEMVARGDRERAEAMFARAEADADVALAVTRAQKTRAEAEQVKQRLDSLKEGM